VNGPRVELVPGGLVTSANNEADVGQTPRAAADCVIKSTYLKFLFPNIWMNHISDKLKVVIYFAPVDDENTVLYIRFYSRAAGSRALDGAVAFLGKFGNIIVERQDRRVVVTQRPKASALKSQEKLLSGDGPIIQYRKMREELKK
jgi:phenylpropionate dioxygenase-like ring-hydroxylating dioxygenase large terminal subunit